MIRCTILAMLLIGSPALADPIPKESDAAKIKRVWGVLADESQKVKVKLDGDSLRMTLPAEHDYVFHLDPKIGRQISIPHLAKTVKGDFVATVKILSHKLPEDHDKGSFLDPLVGSGILIVVDSKTRYYFGQGIVPKNNKHELEFHLGRLFPDSLRTLKSGARKPAQKKTDDVWIRLIRKGNRIDNEFSYDDGKTWQHFYKGIPECSFVEVEEVQLGVFAEHTAGVETTAVFEHFEITKPKK